MKISKLLAQSVIIFSLSSCALTIKNFDSYQKQFLNKTAFMPSKEALENKPMKVVVFALDENQNQVANQANLGEALADNIQNVLGNNRLAEIVDRKANSKLEKEIALAETKKSGSYKGAKVADYAISGSISNADFNSKYSSGSTYINPKNGQVVSIPPQYKYTSQVAGNIKIYELPNLTVVENIEFEGVDARSENVSQNGGLSLGALQIGGEKAAAVSRDDGLVRKAGGIAIKSSETEIKNFFAKRGYVLEKRVLDDKSIFKISLGSEDGIKHGDKFEVIGQFESQNAITNETEIERRIIATGEVSNLIFPKTCWVGMDDKKVAQNIRLGDMVKMKYKRSMLEKTITTVSPMLK